MLRSRLDDRFDLAGCVDDDFGLGQIEIDRPPPLAAPVQDVEQLPHQLELRHEVAVLLHQLRRLRRQDRVDVRIGHPRRGVDDAVVELVPHDRTVGVDFHQARLHEAIDARVEAADAGGELRRKHVNGALGKVHRRRALVAFLIERGAFGHVMRHVGDVHAEPVMAVRQLLDADRIVEVARVLAIDGDRDRLTEIGAPFDVLGADRAERERFLDRRFAVHVRDAVLADDDLGVDPLLVDVAEHLDDLADRPARRGGPRRDFNDDHLARLGRSPLARRHMHIGHDAAIERLHEAETRVVDVEAADDRRIAALENADDAPFEPVLRRPALDAREHAIAVHRFLDVGGRDVHVRRVAAGLVWNHEAESRRMHLKTADDKIHLVRQADAAALGLDELAGRDERFQQTSKRRAFFLRNLERFGELARRGGMRDFLTHQLEDLFSREHCF